MSKIDNSFYFEIEIQYRKGNNNCGQQRDGFFPINNYLYNKKNH